MALIKLNDLLNAGGVDVKVGYVTVADDTVTFHNLTDGTTSTVDDLYITNTGVAQPDYASGQIIPVTQPVPTISVSSQGLITASYTPVAGTVSDVTQKSATQQLTVKGQQTYTPGTSDQVIPAGQYLTGQQVIKGDANLLAQNILSGKTIFSVTGTATSDATATANDIVSGKTAYVNGSKLSGSLGGFFDETGAKATSSSVHVVCYPVDYTKDMTSMESTFNDFVNMHDIGWFDTSNVTKMSYIFRNCQSLVTIPLLNTSNVENTTGAFYRCISLTTIPLLDTSKVTVMSGTFYHCTALTIIPQLDTSKVRYMIATFHNCTSLTTIPLLDLSSVEELTDAFDGCNALTTLAGFQNVAANFDLSYSPLLTHQSLINVLNNLYSGTLRRKLFLGVTNLAKLTDSEKAIAINKGWILA